jgi:DNA invertase Pin-like site-specific DNA recombinase
MISIVSTESAELPQQSPAVAGRKAILYARFSPRPNADECESCEVQLGDLREWCRQRGIVIEAEEHDDALSGDDAERPGLERALAGAKRGRLLLCRKFDRISRDTRHLLGVALDLARRGVQLESITEGRYDPNDDEFELLFTILAGLGQYQRKKIKRSTRDKMLQHQACGRRMSKQPPYGMELDPDSPPVMHDGIPGQPSGLRKNEKEQAVIARIIKEFDSGEGLPSIVQSLTKAKIPCRAGRWHASTVRKILLRNGREMRAVGRPRGT